MTTHCTGSTTEALVICRDEPQGCTGRWECSHQGPLSLSSFTLLLTIGQQRTTEGFHVGDDIRRTGHFSGQGRAESLPVTLIPAVKGLSAKPTLAASGWRGPALVGVMSCVILFLAEAKLSSFWQLIVDEKKQIFTSEKFLLMASEDGELLPSQLNLRLGPTLSEEVFREDPPLTACCFDQSALQKPGSK